MKKWILAVGLLAMTALAYGFWRHTGGSVEEISPQSRPASVKPNEVIGVEAFMRETNRSGVGGVVEGVVASRSMEDRTLALIDLKEVQECSTVTCSSLVLPVRWRGKMPEVKDIVRVEGRVEDDSGKMIFSATKITDVRPASGGAK